MASWEFVDDKRDAELRDAPPLPGPAPLELEDLGVYEVAEGWVSPYRGGIVPDIAKVVTPGWFAKVLLSELLDHTYAVGCLKVATRTGEQELRPGTLVALFPPEHLEIARERTNRLPE